MARSEFTTWLSLDRWAQIMGINPLNFNGFSATTYFKNNVCGEVFFQYDWQHSDRIGRDTIAQAILEAEQEIAREAGFNLLPDWTLDERIPYTKPGVPGAYNVWGTNPRGFAKSVELGKGHIISGGIRAKTLIQASAAVVRTDVDGDGYSEKCTVTVATSVTDANEIRIYYEGNSGADAWEIRPITVVISGGVATITFKSWQIPVWEKLEELDVQPLNADTGTNYETAVDVYRVYNDPSTQATFLWENSPADCCGSCSACTLNAQTACFHLRDQRLGICVPSPATWDASSSTFTAGEFDACREPDQVRFWYYSGWRNPNLTRSYVNLDPYWEMAIAAFAASKFDRPVCGCSNVSSFIDKYRRDAAYSSLQEGGFSITPELAANKLGTTAGALYAYKQIHRNGVRVIK